MVSETTDACYGEVYIYTPRRRRRPSQSLLVAFTNFYRKSKS
jgi:hypothetical protein